jgi:hypothetical protein
MTLLNSHLFDQVELDSDLLTPQMTLVTQVGSAARYRGDVTNPDHTAKSFSLVVLPSPAEPSLNLDISQSWVGLPTYTVMESGYVVVSVLSGPGKQTIRIWNDQGVLLDNKALRKDQIIVLRILRPGTHVITDKTGGATCKLTVQYPQPGVPPATSPIKLQVNQIDPTHTKMDQSQITASVLQAIAIHVQDKTHIITTLAAKTDRVGKSLVTTPVG